jgi:hypothetical protein
METNMSTGRFYVVYIERLPSVTFDELKQKMNLSRSWYRLDQKTWILYTTSDKDKWYSRLSPLVKDEGNLFICRLDNTERQGWMNKKFWEWMKKFEEEGDISKNT